MNTIETKIVKHIFAKEVRQGYHHAGNIRAIFRILREACEKEFTEDNTPTLEAFLREQFEATFSGKSDSLPR